MVPRNWVARVSVSIRRLRSRAWSSCSVFALKLCQRVPLTVRSVITHSVHVSFVWMLATMLHANTAKFNANKRSTSGLSVSFQSRCNVFVLTCVFNHICLCYCGTVLGEHIHNQLETHKDITKSATSIYSRGILEAKMQRF